MRTFITSTIAFLSILTFTNLWGQSNTPHITLLTCLGGERLISEKIVSIRWQCTGYDGTVDLTLWNRKTKDVKIIASRIPATLGVYQWKISDNFAGNDNILTIKASDNMSLSTKSKGYFSILPKTSTRGIQLAQLAVASEAEENEFNNANMICEQTVCKIKTFRIGRIYPQPATNGTISIDIETYQNAADVKAELFSITGQKIATLWEGNLKKGASTVSIALNDINTGSYIFYLKNKNGEVVDYNKLIVAEVQR